MTLDTISQTILLLSSVLGTWLLSRKEPWMRWGYVVCLVAQPCWLYTAFLHHTWGIFLLNIWTTYTWGQGVYNYWWKK